MAISVLAELVDLVGDLGRTAVYRFTGEPDEPSLEVSLTLGVDGVRADPDPATAPASVRKGVAAVATERADVGAWPERVVRQS